MNTRPRPARSGVPLLALSTALVFLGVSAAQARGPGLVPTSATAHIGVQAPPHAPAGKAGTAKPLARAGASPPSGTKAPVTTSAALTNPPSQLSVDIAHLSLVQFSLNGTIGANGAMGMNLLDKGWYSLGEQGPFEHLLHAAATQSAAEMATVLTALEYTYAHQNADGSWPSVAIPGSPYPPGGEFVGQAFFYSDLGRSLGILQDSAWFQTSSATGALRARLNALRPGIASGLRWLGTSASHISIFAMGANDTNRGAAAAEAFLLVGQWVNDSADITTGEQLLQHVEANQLPDGTILESGGFDPGYQQVSLNHLWDIYFHLSGSLVSLRTGVWNELQRGLAKEQTVVSPSGQINYSHGSRTGCGGEKYHGQPKQGGGQALSRALVFTAATAGASALLVEAAAVINYYNTHSHSHCT
jgi:hypothetical protein